MNLSKFLIVLGICTLVCWFVFFGVILFINPFEAGFLQLVFFYFSLALALIGSFSTLGIVLRSIFRKDELVHRHMNIASRQSLLFTGLLIFALILQSKRYLTGLNIGILIAMAIFIELFFISYKKFNK